MRFSSSSLTLRLSIASVVFLVPLLMYSGYTVKRAMLKSQQAAEKEALRGQIHQLLAAAAPTKKGLKLPANLPEPRYSTVNSGLIAWIVDGNNNVFWHSRSADLVAEPDFPKFEQTFSAGSEQFASFKLGNEEYFVVTYDTLWDINKVEKPFRFIVAHNQAAVQAEMEAFNSRLNRWLRALALLLIVVQTLIARWTLYPLRRLAKDLEKVEKGERQTLAPNYPADIQPVTDNLNKVLRNELMQKERYRNSMADLAHSLKTPLSVIRGYLESRKTPVQDPLAQVVEEQVARMSSIVEHQLRRASAQFTPAHAQPLIHLAVLIKRIVSALLKVYQDKHMQCVVKVPDALALAADEGDLMELIGNLIENAFKYGKSQILITAKQDNHWVHIFIEDNGPGIPPEQHAHILTRGTRLDTATAGQGIGLAVAVDILTGYGGELAIVASSLGGAGFSIRLPHVG